MADPTPELAPNQVRLGARVFDLVPPASYAQRHEVITAAMSNPQRGFAAALGACCPKLERATKVTYAGCGYVPLRYGGELIDALVSAKPTPIPLPEILEAGGIAYRLIVDSIISEDEVKEAVGNSETRKAG